MTEPQQIDIRSMNPDDRMERIHTASLLTHLNQSDARIQATKANVTIWHDVLAGQRLGDVLNAAHDHMRRYDPKNPENQALSIAVLGYALRQARERKERLEHARRPIGPPRRSGPPPHVAEYIRKYKERHPELLERKP